MQKYQLRTKEELFYDWLKRHNAEKVGDSVFDGEGVIVTLVKGLFESWVIVFQPRDVTHNLGNGAGNRIKIEF